MSPPPDPRDWGARRAALERKLGVSFDRIITPHELVFYKRFAALGNTFTPIMRDLARRSTNDFTWHQRARDVEVKSFQKPNYWHINKAIFNAVTKATLHYDPVSWPVVKDTFIVDIRDNALDRTLLRSLEGYNRDGEAGRIAELWVMTQGRLVLVHLRT